MAEKQRYLDVWILESNTVYREVPFTVVADWIQQGRLLENDMVRNSGRKDWKALGEIAALAAYLPRPEPMRPQDQAEALEAVQLEFGWKKAPHDDDEDIDMIPLIDVSLVLLIFFMLTAAGAGTAAPIPTPGTEYAGVTDVTPLWVGINRTADDPTPIYSLGEMGKKSEDAADNDIRSREELLRRLLARLERKSGKVDVTINAHKDIEDGVVLGLTLDLCKPPYRNFINSKFTGVSEKTP
jgi:biopolymer transport protein ExbD